MAEEEGFEPGGISPSPTHRLPQALPQAQQAWSAFCSALAKFHEW
jgi:hypothetical protein